MVFPLIALGVLGVVGLYLFQTGGVSTGVGGAFNRLTKNEQERQLAYEQQQYEFTQKKRAEGRGALGNIYAYFFGEAAAAHVENPSVGAKPKAPETGLINQTPQQRARARGRNKRYGVNG